MRKIYKTLLASALLLMLQVSTVFAVSVTYSLKTHVDGRTLTETKSMASGASLNSNMPQKLWRAFCTYSYYSDEALTQPISVAPEENATVYVDYVFDPPFFVSSEGVEYYYYFNAYIASTKYFLCDDLGAVKSNSSYRNHALWALYGDGYCINLKAKQTGQWLTYNTSAPVIAGAPMTTGWQLYECSFTNNGAVHGTVVLGTTNNDNQILHFDNTATPPSSPGIPSSQHAMGRFVLENITNTGWNQIAWDNHHKLHNTASNYSTNMLSNSSFFFTVGTSLNIYSTVWRILQADGTWLPDIITQKESSQVAIGMPPSTKFKEKDNCNYDRYYKDATFTEAEKYPDNYMIPVTGNTIIYIKETYKWGEPYSDHWITLAVPYNVDDLAGEFGTLSDGTTPAVRVLEYTGLTTNAENTKYTLTFTVTDKIEPHKPYLFKADEVLVGKNLCFVKPKAKWDEKTDDVLEGYVDGKKITFDKTNNSPNVTMIGTYLDKELTVQSQHPDLLYFYFGYDKRYDPESDAYDATAAEGKLPYNFYRVTNKNVNIKPFHCYFMIEGAPAGAKFMMMDNFGNEITSVEGIDADSFIQTTGRIYNLNGQMMGTDLESLPRGIYIVNGKKVMK